MMSRRTLIIVAIVLLVLGLAGYWVASHIERYTRTVDTGPTLDVALNPWYGAQTFLEQQQKESHRSFNLYPVLEKLQPYDALVLFNSGSIANPSTQQKLMDWMQGGGHLIVTAQEEWDFDAESADPLLDRFGVRFYYMDEEDEEYDDEYAEQEDDAYDDTSFDDTADADADELVDEQPETPAAQTCTFSNYDNLYSIKWGEDTLQVEARAGYTLDDEYDEALRTGDSWPNALLQYRVGAGKLTVLMDPSIWHNDRIGDYDHAFFLWQLVQQDDIIWFVSSNESENLLDLLWRTAPYLLLGIGVTLFIWGWRRWVRFGPIEPEPANAHRQLLEHIEAATRFDWNHHQGQSMVDQLRQEILHEMELRHNLSFQRQQDKWVELLAQRCPLNPQQIQQAMTQPSPLREHPWAELISDLQIIRNAL